MKSTTAGANKRKQKAQERVSDALQLLAEEGQSNKRTRVHQTRQTTRKDPVHGVLPAKDCQKNVPPASSPSPSPKKATPNPVSPGNETMVEAAAADAAQHDTKNNPIELQDSEESDDDSPKKVKASTKKRLAIQDDSEEEEEQEPDPAMKKFFDFEAVEDNEQKQEDDGENQPEEDDSTASDLAFLPIEDDLPGTANDSTIGKSHVEDLKELKSTIATLDQDMDFTTGTKVSKNRFITIRVKGDILIGLPLLPEAVDRAPPHHYALDNLKKFKGGESFKKFKNACTVHACPRLCDPKNPMAFYSTQRDGKLANMPWEVFLAVASKKPSPAKAKKWGENLAKVFGICCKKLQQADKLKYPMHFGYAGDLTPPKLQPLSYYICIPDILDLLTNVIFRGQEQKQIIKKQVMTLYFDDESLKVAKKVVANHKPGTAYGFNDTSDFGEVDKWF